MHKNGQTICNTATKLAKKNWQTKLTNTALLTSSAANFNTAVKGVISGTLNLQHTLTRLVDV